MVKECNSPPVGVICNQSVFAGDLLLNLFNCGGDLAGYRLCDFFAARTRGHVDGGQCVPPFQMADVNILQCDIG